MPWYQLGQDAGRFVQLLYADGWIIGFDWQAWATQAHKIADSDELERADVQTMRRLLVVIVRQDRFVEGTIADAFETGLVVRILRRLESLTTAGELG